MSDNALVGHFGMKIKLNFNIHSSLQVLKMLLLPNLLLFLNDFPVHQFLNICYHFTP